jgi:AcrR family transcriptional regulator
MNYIQPPNYTKTQLKIIDSAEHLFASHGIHATTLRMITSAAEVNLAAVNYHFGNKENLIQAVLLRRLIPLNNERHRQLDRVLHQATTANQSATARQILHSFIKPTILFGKQNEAGKDFMTIVTTMMMNPDNEFRQLFISIMTPLLNQLLQALANALPNISPNTLYLRLQFSLGAMMFSMREIDLPLSVQHSNNDIELLIAEITSFVSIGMEQP